MRSLKNHFGVIFPLIALLFCIQFISLTGSIIKDYERLMNRDYSIIIVSSKELTQADIKPLVDTFESLETLSPKAVLDRLSKDISAKNIAVLQNALPKFYSLRLNAFPSANYMNNIKDKILKIGSVSRVETFSKTHDKIYKFLNLIKSISEIFSALIVILGLTLIFKQMRIWLYEHKERIDIMTLFGASFWLKSGVLFKIAVIDSIIAVVCVIALYALLPSFESINLAASDVGIILPQINALYDGGFLLIMALALSVTAVCLVMRKAQKNSL